MCVLICVNLCLCACLNLYLRTMALPFVLPQRSMPNHLYYLSQLLSLSTSLSPLADTPNQYLYHLRFTLHPTRLNYSLTIRDLCLPSLSMLLSALSFRGCSSFFTFHFTRFGHLRSVAFVLQMCPICFKASLQIFSPCLKQSKQSLAFKSLQRTCHTLPYVATQSQRDPCRPCLILLRSE